MLSLTVMVMALLSPCQIEHRKNSAPPMHRQKSTEI